MPADLTASDLQQLAPIVAAASFVFGLALGSFLNVCIYRMPRELSVVRPRSACPNCKAPIRAYDNIPVLSWLLLRGRCRDCKAPISPRYAAVELLTALLFLSCFLRYGYSFDTLKFSSLSFLLLGLIFTDIDCKLLPDLLTLPGIFLGIGSSLVTPMPAVVSPWIPYTYWLRVPHAVLWQAQSLLESLLGTAIGALFIYGAGWLYLRLRGIEGMGFGDVKMMAMVGAFLGVEGALFTIGVAAMGATAFGIGTMLLVWVKRTQRRMSRGHRPAADSLRRAWLSASLIYRNYEIPFGAFLGTAAFLAFFYGARVMQWYVELWSRVW